jgi:hypothetical protein
MKRIKNIVAFLFVFFPFLSFSQSETEKVILMEIREIKADNKDIKKELQEFKLQNEKRFGEIEKRLFSLENVNNVRFEEVNKRIDILLYVMIAILTGVFGLIGFVVWDRQVSLKPIKEDSKEVKREIELLKEKEQKIEIALKNLANIEPKFQEILKNTGIL